MSSTRVAFLVALAFGAIACSEDAVTPAPPLDVDGDWIFSDLVTAAFGTCTAAGVATFNQAGESLTGVVDATEGVCNWTDGGSDDNSGQVPISSGTVTDSTMSFMAGICEFTATSLDENRIEGTEVCRVQAVVLDSLTGTFTLTR